MTKILIIEDDDAFRKTTPNVYGVIADASDANRIMISVALADLAPGMVLRSNVETKDGTLVLSAGHQITDMTLEKIQNFERISRIKELIFVEASEPVVSQSQSGA